MGAAARGRRRAARGVRASVGERRHRAGATERTDAALYSVPERGRDEWCHPIVCVDRRGGAERAATAGEIPAAYRLALRCAQLRADPRVAGRCNRSRVYPRNLPRWLHRVVGRLVPPERGALRSGTLRSDRVDVRCPPHPPLSTSVLIVVIVARRRAAGARRSTQEDTRSRWLLTLRALGSFHPLRSDLASSFVPAPPPPPLRYGGPHVQFVCDAWGRASADARAQRFRDMGFVVWKVRSSFLLFARILLLLIFLSFVAHLFASGSSTIGDLRGAASPLSPRSDAIWRGSKSPIRKTAYNGS